MSVMFYKIRQRRQQGFLTGFAASVCLDDGRVLLQDRRIPVATVEGGALIERAHRLGDLELSGDQDSGWAVWSYPVDTPLWWESPSMEKEPDSGPAAEDADDVDDADSGVD